jgi:hypothetical protein
MINNISDQIVDYSFIFRSDDKQYDRADKIAYLYGLKDTLYEYIDKYLSLSKSDTHEFVGGGSTAAVFRIGDYAFKIIYTKWSYEDIICPNNYLILSNLEELYLRDENNVVTCGLEVQPYLSKTTDDIEYKYVSNWFKDFNNLGLEYADNLIHGMCGSNARILDDYRNACTNDPESLPDWFKECPLVLVDRDRVYRRGTVPRQRMSTDVRKERIQRLSVVNI